MAEPDGAGLPLRATLPLYSGFSKSLKRRRRGADERSCCSRSRPRPSSPPTRNRGCPLSHAGSSSSSAEVLRVQALALAPETANGTVTSTASGARESPFSERIASFSCAEAGRVVVSSIAIPYLRREVGSALLVVRPVRAGGRSCSACLPSSRPSRSALHRDRPWSSARRGRQRRLRRAERTSRLPPTIVRPNAAADAALQHRRPAHSLLFQLGPELDCSWAS